MAHCPAWLKQLLELVAWRRIQPQWRHSSGRRAQGEVWALGQRKQLLSRCAGWAHWLMSIKTALCPQNSFFISFQHWESSEPRRIWSIIILVSTSSLPETKMILIAFCFPSFFVKVLTLTLLLNILGFLEPSFALRENKETNKLRKHFILT